MRRVIPPGSWAGLLLAGSWLVGSPAAAQEVVAVLSSDSPAYQEALAGFQEGFGRSVPTFTLSKGDVSVPNSAKVIVTFGGKAASYPYPQGATLIYALAPAMFIGPGQHAGPRIRIFVAPLPEILISRLKEIQPGLRRLAILDISASPAKAGYVRGLQQAAEANGITLRVEYMSHADEFPDRLRSLAGQVDALWLAPNPLLITPSAFAAANQFARANNTPLYAPMDNLVDKGASASVASSFRESGRTAGHLAAQAVAGTLGASENRYPEKYELTLNLTAAVQSGLTIPPDVVKKADRVVP